MHFKKSRTILCAVLVAAPFIVAADENVNGIDKVNLAIQRAIEAEKNIQLPVQKDQGGKFKETFNSDKLFDSVEKEKERLGKKLNPDSSTAKGKTEKSSIEEKSSAPRFSSEERVYLFISESVPEDTLRVYAKDIAKLPHENSFFVMRGFVGGMKNFKPTIDFIQRIRLKKKSCDFKSVQCEQEPVEVLIDPLLYEKFKINRVPAVVYDSGISSYVVYGDISLVGSLDLMRKEANSSTLEYSIKVLRGEAETLKEGKSYEQR